MIQTKTRASRFGGRLFKSAATSALALSAATGSVFLFINEANASTTTCNNPVLPATCTTVDPFLGITYSNTGSISSTSAGFPTGSTFINLEGTGLDFPAAQQQIDTDFNMPGTGNYTGGLISSVYQVTANTPGFPFSGIDLSASGIGAFTVRKEVFADAALTQKLVPDLILSGAGFVPVQTFAPVSQIWIRDTFNNPVTGQSSIDNVQNTVRNTPGPLPILGAGAAFGFSRKLRGRIKASRTA